MNRDELVEAAARAFCLSRDANDAFWVVWADDMAAVVDAVEPLIRADERDATIATLVPGLSAGAHAIGDLLLRQSLADLRANVEALPRWRMDDTLIPVLAYEDVIALIDGAGR